MIKNRKTFVLIYVFAFFWALSSALVSYIQSSYLGAFVDIKYVGLLVALATVFNLLAIWRFPRFIRRCSNYKVSFVLIIVLAASCFLLGHLKIVWLVALFFIVNFSATNLLGINIDIFLEDISQDVKTGRIRTRFMTIVNAAWVFSPLVMGNIAGVNAYAAVYFWSGIVLLPAIILLFWEKRWFKDAVKYKDRAFGRIGELFFASRNLRNILITQLILRLFYCWMVIYTPLYLHNELGISWPQIGIIFTIMLLPFVIFQIPAGFLADRYWGEKEILIIGLFIMGGATGIMFFINSASILVWAAILFLSRTGASLTEAMCESYFFKLVDKQDIDLIGLYRNLAPLGWLIGSLLASAILLILSLKFLFLILEVALFYAVYPSAELKDTK
jgi:MFS family permease